MSKIMQEMFKAAREARRAKAEQTAAIIPEEPPQKNYSGITDLKETSVWNSTKYLMNDCASPTPPPSPYADLCARVRALDPAAADWLQSEAHISVAITLEGQLHKCFWWETSPQGDAYWRAIARQLGEPNV